MEATLALGLKPLPYLYSKARRAGRQAGRLMSGRVIGCRTGASYSGAGRARRRRDEKGSGGMNKAACSVPFAASSVHF